MHNYIAIFSEDFFLAFTVIASNISNSDALKITSYVLF